MANGRGDEPGADAPHERGIAETCEKGKAVVWGPVPGSPRCAVDARSNRTLLVEPSGRLLHLPADDADSAAISGRIIGLKRPARPIVRLASALAVCPSSKVGDI